MTLLGPSSAGKVDRDRLPDTVHALVLAAGRGSRFGGGKLHALYQGTALLSHTMAVVSAACERRVLIGAHVVVADQDSRTAQLVCQAGLEMVLNDDPEAGMSRSLRLGLEALEQDHPPAAALIFLGDQPLVRLEVIEMLTAAWREGRGTIIRPRYAAAPQIPGHPVILSRAVWQQARSLQGDTGFNAVDVTPGQTVILDVPGHNPDVDTRADLQALEGLRR